MGAGQPWYMQAFEGLDIGLRIKRRHGCSNIQKTNSQVYKLGS